MPENPVQWDDFVRQQVNNLRPRRKRPFPNPNPPGPLPPEQMVIIDDVVPGDRIGGWFNIAGEPQAVEGDVRFVQAGPQDPPLQPMLNLDMILQRNEERKKPQAKKVQGELVLLPPRGEATPKFFMDYENLHDYNMRITGTFITVDNQIGYVHSMSDGAHDELILDKKVRGTGARMIFSDKVAYVVLNPKHHEIDFRAPEPGFVESMTYAYFLNRGPERIQRQGMCGDNTRIIDLNQGTSRKISGYGDGCNDVISLMNSRREDRKFSMKDFEAMKANTGAGVGWFGRRLSNKVAYFYNNKEETRLFWKDRMIGKINPGGPVVTDEAFCSPEWVRGYLKEVNVI